MAHGHDQHAAGQHSHSAGGHAQVVDIVTSGAKYSAGHHAHTIVPMRILVTILTLLMLFTVLTVSAAWVEQWWASAFNVVIPQWINVAVALSIGFVKATLVVLYFMQLRYDNPMNALVLIFTIFVFLFFIGFTMLDLGSRNTLYAYKARAISPGGAIEGTYGSGPKPIVAIAQTNSLARIERWVTLQGEPKQARAELVNGVRAALGKLTAAIDAGNAVGPQGRADLALLTNSINSALKPFETEAVTDAELRELLKAIQRGAGSVGSSASQAIVQIGEFEKSCNTLVDDYRLRSRPLPKADAKFALAEIERLTAAKKELPKALQIIEERYVHTFEEMLKDDHGGHHGSAHATGSSPAQSRPRSGLTLPEFAGADKPGEHGAPSGEKPGH